MFLLRWLFDSICGCLLVGCLLGSLVTCVYMRLSVCLCVCLFGCVCVLSHENFFACLCEVFVGLSGCMLVCMCSSPVLFSARHCIVCHCVCSCVCVCARLFFCLSGVLFVCVCVWLFGWLRVCMFVRLLVRARACSCNAWSAYLSACLVFLCLSCCVCVCCILGMIVRLFVCTYACWFV